MLNCRSGREIVVIRGKEWDINLWVKNFMSVTISYVPRPSCPWNSQLIKWGCDWTMLSGCSELGTKASYSGFVFQAVLNTAIISAISWHVSVARLRLVWVCGRKGKGWHTCHPLNHCPQQLAACSCEALRAHGVGGRYLINVYHFFCDFFPGEKLGRT